MYPPFARTVRHSIIIIFLLTHLNLSQYETSATSTNINAFSNTTASPNPRPPPALPIPLFISFHWLPPDPHTTPPPQHVPILSVYMSAAQGLFERSLVRQHEGDYGGWPPERYNFSDSESFLIIQNRLRNNDPHTIWILEMIMVRLRDVEIVDGGGGAGSGMEGSVLERGCHLDAPPNHEGGVWVVTRGEVHKGAGDVEEVVEVDRRDGGITVSDKTIGMGVSPDPVIEVHGYSPGAQHLDFRATFIAALKVFKRVAVEDKGLILSENKVFEGDGVQWWFTVLGAQMPRRMSWKDVSWATRDMLVFMKKRRGFGELRASIFREGAWIGVAELRVPERTAVDGG